MKSSDGGERRHEQWGENARPWNRTKGLITCGGNKSSVYLGTTAFKAWQRDEIGNDDKSTEPFLEQDAAPQGCPFIV
ncbi:hypothetical protein PAXRUDRAFT_589882 [Paxillus rubicundulus Ve08.2h10]|uniref:Uncharacterized protein n=1 Tax=Paxillus rubicundulus Ve08.2h10 TaxID=930991 RepID=A0A0D0DZ61_9AGAM|nr:hypothetical protein PAXRUDRAFT_589882 [Paxillus rubicundulus Ve08.2h10]